MVPPSATSGRRSFRFRRLIGSGAFGEVYLAELVTGGGFAKVVAVKVLKSEFLEEKDIVSRMRDEARLLGHLRHPSIVQADDLVMLGGRLSIVMEYVPGANLLWLIHPRRNADPVPPKVVAAIMSGVAEALEAAWSRPSALTGEPLRVLHRDIKPSNIRITPDGGVKVLDFGVARADAIERETSTHNQLIGSLTFLAPEVFLSHPVLPATDIYALGVTFYESIARSRFGRCGLSADHHRELLDKRLASLKLSSWGGCAEPVRHLLGEMLAFEPVHRPTAAGVARFCRDSALRMGGPSLKEWARHVVPVVAARAEQDPKGELSGATLDEDSTQSVLGSAPMAHTWNEGADSVTEVTSSRRRRGLLLAIALMLLVLVPALAALGAGAAWYVQGRSAAREAASQRLPTASTQPAVEPEPPPASVEPSPGSSSAPTAGVPRVGELESAPVVGVSPASSPAKERVAPTRETPAQAATTTGSSRPATTTSTTASTGSSLPTTTTPAPELTTVVPEPSLDLQVSAPRRSLRNTQLHANISTGAEGCGVTVFWKTEGLTSWERQALPGAGATYGWTLDVTGQHRPAILYYVTVTGCGEASHGSAASPQRIVVL